MQAFQSAKKIIYQKISKLFIQQVKNQLKNQKLTTRQSLKREHKVY